MKCPACGFDNIAGADDCESCGSSLVMLTMPQPMKGLSDLILSGDLSQLKPRQAPIAKPETPLKDVVAAMRKDKIGCTLVMEGRKLTGILTERDLLLKTPGTGKGTEKLRAKDVMRTEPICLKHHQPVSFAFHHMSVGGFGHLPVEMEDGSLRVVSSRDLLAYLTA